MLIRWWKDWCWSSNTLVTWCKELTQWKRPWCWERLKAGEGDSRRWHCWMASPTPMDESLSKLNIVKDREAWSVAIHGVGKSQTQLSNWTMKQVLNESCLLPWSLEKGPFLFWSGVIWTALSTVKEQAGQRSTEKRPQKSLCFRPIYRETCLDPEDARFFLSHSANTWLPLVDWY